METGSLALHCSEPSNVDMPKWMNAVISVRW
jgi:hypothetical protein